MARRAQICADVAVDDGKVVGGRRIVQQSDGNLATATAGQATFERGQATGNLAGKLICGPQIVRPKR